MLEKLAQLANEGLKKMYLPDDGIFCHRLVGKKLAKEGKSLLYTLMVIIGLTKAKRMGLKSIFSPGRLFNNVWKRSDTKESLGLLACILWAAALLEKDYVNRLLKQSEKLLSKYETKNWQIPTMETAWLLCGVCEYLLKEKNNMTILISQNLFQILQRSFDKDTSLFSFTTKGIRKNIIKKRINENLGSFASQIYPIMALSKYYQVSHDDRALKIAQYCADTICKFQGPLGQWWWIYNVKKGFVVEGYPVYSVHQDAMAFMGLLELQKSLGKPKYENYLKRGLGWMEGKNESKIRMYDEKNKIIWRAIQRKENPSSQETGPWGLGKKSYFKMQLAGLLNSSIVKKFPLPDKYELLLESRPYHNGWILLAWSMSNDK